MEQPELSPYREAWLQAAASFLLGYMIERGLPPVDVRVSCGWPARGGLAPRTAVIGQCFAGSVCQDGKPQIFVSPRIAESVQVLGTLLHELVHASIGCQFGHRKEFSQAARKVGLAGPPTATTVGESLLPLLRAYVEKVGPYPHAAITATPKTKVGSRLRLYQCSCEPAVKVRVACDTFAAVCLACDQRFQLVEKE